MGGFVNSPASGPGSGVTLDSPPGSPPSPDRAALMNLGWGSKPEGGMGAEASNPQIMALQGVKLIEMGAQVLSAALPPLAQAIQAFVQQLQVVVPQAMSQAVGGASAAGSPMGPPSPVPMAPGAQPPPGVSGGAAPM